MQYAKLSELTEFTTTAVQGFKYKKWNEQERKMEVSDTPKPEFNKKYILETKKGILDLSAYQYGSILELYSEGGKSNIIEKTVAVKTNGQEGKDIRYFFNKPLNTPATPVATQPDELPTVQYNDESANLPF